MNEKRYFPNQHPLRNEVRDRRITLWQLRHATGVSEAKLSRHLNGIDPMPDKLEKRMVRLLKLFGQVGRGSLKAKTANKKNKTDPITRILEEIAPKAGTDILVKFFLVLIFLVPTTGRMQSM